MQAILGIAIFVGIAWALSEARASARLSAAAVGLALQLILAFALLGIPFVADALLALNAIVRAVEAASTAGASFLFGYLGGGSAPFEVSMESAMYLFAFRVLPQVIVFSVIVAVLWHWRILPLVVRGVGWALQRTLGVGGAVGTAGAATIFLGMVETPLVIRAYLARMSRSELFTVMSCGMSTVAGSVMVLYATVLADQIEGALGHVVTASVLNVIGAVYLSRLLVPPEGAPTDVSDVDGLQYESNMDAITRGTSDGLQLAVNVGAMVLVLVSLVALLNYVLGTFSMAGEPLSMERLAGIVFAPIAWLIGVPWSEAAPAGALLASKLILNELVAYLQLASLDPSTFSADTRLVVIYALCGFTNFGSLGILIGGLTTLVPSRRSEILRVAPKSLLSGFLTAAITGAVVAIVTLVI